jgi:hypothetical protein
MASADITASRSGRRCVGTSWSVRSAILYAAYRGSAESHCLCSRRQDLSETRLELPASTRYLTTTVVMPSTAATEYSRIGKQRGAAPLLIQKGRFQQQRSQVTVTSHGVEQCVLVRDMLDVGCQDMLDTARRLRGGARVDAEIASGRLVGRRAAVSGGPGGAVCGGLVSDVTAEVGVSPQSLRTWRRRYLRPGLAGLADQSKRLGRRRGRPFGRGGAGV